MTCLPAAYLKGMKVVSPGEKKIATLPPLGTLESSYLSFTFYIESRTIRYVGTGAEWNRRTEKNKTEYVYS